MFRFGVHLAAQIFCAVGCTPKQNIHVFTDGLLLTGYLTRQLAKNTYTGSVSSVMHYNHNIKWLRISLSAWDVYVIVSVFQGIPF